jgi:hypothetical protein
MQRLGGRAGCHEPGRGPQQPAARGGGDLSGRVEQAVDGHAGAVPSTPESIPGALDRILDRSDRPGDSVCDS